MITVRDLAKRLRDFANARPENGQMEVMLVYDGDIALQFGGADNHTVIAPDGKMGQFLVFKSDPKSAIRLELKRKEISHAAGTSH